MKKRLLGCFAGLFCLLSFTGCKQNGIEKEYVMDIQGEPIAARLKTDETQEVSVVHCKRGMSLYNYYVIIPELPEAFTMPLQLKCKVTGDEVKTIILNEKNKSQTVSDHGYKFLSWIEEGEK